MFKTRKVLLVSIFIFLIVLVTGLYAQKAAMRTIKDMDGRVTEVPVDPQRIACGHHASIERVIVLGKGSAIVMMGQPSLWMQKYYPEIRKDVVYLRQGDGDSLEKMLNLKVDLAIYNKQSNATEKYRTAGLNAISGYTERDRPRTIEEFKNNFKLQFRFFGDLLGPEAKKRAEKYCVYFDAKLDKIYSITSKIKNKPTVYYGGIQGGFNSTQGKDTVFHWFVKIAGGEYLPAEFDRYFATVNAEQILGWNPDFIFLGGRIENIDLQKDSVFATMNAVKNNKVNRIPRGFSVWEHGGGEGVLLAIYLAKIFHPEEFKDWNIVKEMKEFYSNIYGKNVTEKDIERILQCLPPI